MLNVEFLMLNALSKTIIKHSTLKNQH